MTRNSIEVNGLKCAYDRAGSGPAIILLHGWAQSAATWRTIAPTLGENYTLYMPDLPGFGSSGSPAAIWDVEAYARFVDEFAHALRVEPYAVIGHSFGARVALTYAASFPVERVVLEAMGPVDEQSVFRYVCMMFACVFHRVRYIATHVASDSTIFPNVRGTVLLVYGSSDWLTPAATGKRMATRIPDSTCVVVPHAGHFVHTDSKETFVRVVAGFLGESVTGVGSLADKKR